MTIEYSNRQGEPITMQRWSELFNDDDYKIIEHTWVGDVMISTVWLGLHHIGGIFETMIFGGRYDDYQERYWTEEKAKAGHKRAVKRVERSQS